MSISSVSNNLVRIALLAFLACAGAGADSIDGSISIAFVDISVDGSESAFLSRYELEDGVILESLDLSIGENDALEIEASGLGDANWYANVISRPGQRLEIEFRADGHRGRLELPSLSPWLESSSTESLGLSLEATYHWRPATELSVRWRHLDRELEERRPIFGLNEFYPAELETEETFDELSVAVDHRGGGWRWRLEQSMGWSERSDEWSPLDGIAIGGDDDLLGTLESSRHREGTTPTTRGLVAYGNERFEVLASVMWSDLDADLDGSSARIFQIGGGSIGQIGFLDRVDASVSNESLAATLRARFALGGGFAIQLDGRTRESETDAVTLGERILSVAGQGGGTEIVVPFDDTNRLDIEDRRSTARLSWERDDLEIWVGMSDSSRELEWRSDVAQELFSAEHQRDSEGLVAGFAWSPCKSLRVNFEHASDEIDQRIYRTDLGEVDRWKLRLGGILGERFHYRIRAASSESNPSAGDVSQLDGEEIGIVVGTSVLDDRLTIGLSVDRLELRTATQLVLADGTAGLSSFDLDGTSFGGHLYLDLEKMAIRFAYDRFEDDGETWPARDWHVAGRVELPVREQFLVGVFVDLFDAADELSPLDDFEATRSGISLTWRLK